MKRIILMILMAAILVPGISWTGAPDLIVSDFEGEILVPYQPDHLGGHADHRRVQLHWTVKNIGNAPCGATVLRVLGKVSGDVPIPAPWVHDGPLERRDFPLQGLEPGQSRNVWEVFAVSNGWIRFGFNAKVNPQELYWESNYANNTRLSTFAPLGPPDLIVSDFEGEIVQPGQPDHFNHVTSRRVQLHWTVKNIGDSPCVATMLRVVGTATGNAPLPSPWIPPNGTLQHRDFPLQEFDPGQSRDVWEVFAVPDGSVKFLFWAWVNIDQTFTESNYVNNFLSSTFQPALAGFPGSLPLFQVPLSVFPSAQVVPTSASSTATFTILGGKPPYQVSASDPGYAPSVSSVTQAGGAFTVAVAPSAPAGTITYTVTDTDNHTATATLAIVTSQQKGISWPALKKLPAEKRKAGVRPGNMRVAGLYRITPVALSGGGVFENGDRVVLKFRHASRAKGFQYRFQHKVKGRWMETSTPRVIRTLTSKSGVQVITTARLQIKTPGQYRWHCRAGEGPWSQWQTFTVLPVTRATTAHPKAGIKPTAQKSKQHTQTTKAPAKTPRLLSLKHGQVLTAPATLKLNAHYTGGGKLVYELLKNGRVIQSNNSGKFPNLPAGHYTVRVRADEPGAKFSAPVPFVVKAKLSPVPIKTNNSKPSLKGNMMRRQVK